MLTGGLDYLKQPAGEILRADEGREATTRRRRRCLDEVDHYCYTGVGHPGDALVLEGRGQVDAGDGVGRLGASAMVLGGHLPRPHVGPRRLVGRTPQLRRRLVLKDKRYVVLPYKSPRVLKS